MDGSEPTRRHEDGPWTGRWTRRRVLIGAGAMLGGLAVPTRAPRATETFSLPRATRAALETSPLVYVSPLLESGAESRCHGEVWFFGDDQDVIIITATDRWKAVAIRKGRDKARLWIGDFGSVGRAGDRYRSAPSFLARARIESDAAVFRRLMTAYATKYADEWDKWGPRFQSGYDDGSRVMIRYAPIDA